MQSPQSGRASLTSPRHPLRALAVALLISAPMATIVAAQVQIESLPSRPVVLEAYAAGSTGGNLPLETEPVELAALRLLALARQDLSEQRSEPARRALELLVARYPDSASATLARRELFRLYSSDAEIGGEKVAAAAIAVAPVAAAASVSTPATPMRTDAVSGWRTTVVSFRRLQDEFRNTIGDRVFFGAGSDELGGRARAVLTAQAQWLVRRPQVEIIIEGHADDAAIGADNDMLAAGRARAVRDRLVAEGVEAGRIIMTAKGNADPVAVCPEGDCSAQNRRAVIAVRLPGVEAGASSPGKGGTAGVERP